MRFYGKIGFYDTVETSPGDWEPSITEKEYRGDVLNLTWRNNQASDKVNTDITISNRISIIANPYAYKNLDKIKYAEFSGIKWTVSSIEVNRPRLILTLGGVYNDGQET